MQVNLVVFRKGGQRKDIPVSKPKTVIGRRQDCDLQVPLEGVSRRHCELTVDGSMVRVKDLASSNGTYVNEVRVSESRIKPGDRLVVGPMIFTVQINGKPDKIEPPPPVVDLDESGEIDIELTPDDLEVDPISALEALAEEDDEDEKP